MDAIPRFTSGDSQEYHCVAVQHGLPGPGSLEQSESVLPFIHARRILAPMLPVFGVRAMQGGRKARRSRFAGLPALHSPALNCLATVHVGSQSQSGATLMLFLSLGTTASNVLILFHERAS